MTTILAKLVAISLWCGSPSQGINGGISKWDVDACRKEMFQCLQGKTTSLQVESCFMGTKLSERKK